MIVKCVENHSRVEVTSYDCKVCGKLFNFSKVPQQLDKHGHVQSCSGQLKITKYTVQVSTLYSPCLSHCLYSAEILDPVQYNQCGVQPVSQLRIRCSFQQMLTGLFSTIDQTVITVRAELLYLQVERGTCGVRRFILYQLYTILSHQCK